MSYEERRLTCRQTRCGNNILCQSLNWQVRACQRNSKCPALSLRTTRCSNPAHNVDKTIIVIYFSFKMTCSTLIARNRTWKLSNTLLAFFHSRRQSRSNITIWRQTHRWCSLINHQFPLRWTWNTLSEKGGHSTLRTTIRIWRKTWLMSFYMVDLHIHKIVIIFFTVWLICLPAMTSAWIFKDTLRNDTQVFLKFRDSILEICLHLINLNCTPNFLPQLMLSSGAGTSDEIPFRKSGFELPAIFTTLPFHLLKSAASSKII